MDILVVNNGSGLSDVKSGGNTRLIYLLRHATNQGSRVTMITTRGGYSLFKREGVLAQYKIVKAAIFREVERGNIDRIIAYVVSTLHSLIKIAALKNYSLVYTPSDYFCDVIPAVFHKILNPETKYVAMIHHRHKRKSGAFRGQILDTISILGQSFSFALIARFADAVFLYDTPEGASIGSSLGVQMKRKYYVRNGVPLRTIKSIAPDVKRFDACFVGGLRRSKGVFDVIDIWERVVNVVPGIKLAVIGGGNEITTQEIQKLIDRKGLGGNISLLGALQSKELYAKVKASKVFLATSHEEGWGISVCEALACGVPVIAYHLPVYEYLGDLIERVKLHDHEAFTSAVISSIQQPQKISKLDIERERFVAELEWDIIMSIELDLISGVVHG